MTQQEQLEVEFPPEMIRTTPKGGKRLSYVPVHEVIQRLNDVLGTGNWTWQVTKVWRDELDPEWVLAYGNLTATVDGVTSSKGGSGGLKLKRTNGTNEIVDLGDEFKGAESDALKKAAQRFGVGIYLNRSPEAIAYEAPVVVRDPVAEGWESADRAKQMWTALKERMKQLPEAEQEGVRKFITAEGILQPPTLADYEKLAARVRKSEARQQPQATEAGPESAERPAKAKPAEQEPDPRFDGAKAIADVFPGAEDVTPAGDEHLAVLGGYLDQFRAAGDRASVAAFNKYAKEKKYPDDRRQMTVGQIGQALDFIENL